MKAEVNPELCVGCGLCADVCSAVFVMEEDKARVKANPIPSDAEECCKQAKDDCPVEAISTEG